MSPYPSLFQDITEILQATVGRHHHHAVAGTDTIIAGREDRGAVTDDAGDQDVRLQGKIAQRDTGSTEILPHLEFHRLHAVIRQCIEGLDIAADRILQRAGIPHQHIGNDLAGRDDALQPQAFRQ